ncbi:MAG: type VI secretion system ATPase TssH [Gammaproteobacteria bacterium]|nr:type VI secretion system ATPase TssH [Gammaproteobacteria bacterium]MBU1482070.1 type VI secretion system ATPase TssH [Gammaproteobacteria bacterium]
MSIKRIKSLLDRLNDHCANTLDAAAGFASGRTHYEVSIEHMLIKLLEDGSGDLARIFRAFDIDADALWQGMLQHLAKNRSGNAGKPSFSPFMVQWFEQAWINASLYYGHDHIRSGVLFDALLEIKDRLPGGHFSQLDGISQEILRQEFKAITEGSVESITSAKSTAANESAGRPGAAISATPDGGALAQFTIDVTARARAGEIDPVFGRDNEIRQMVDILSRRRKNNPILVGEPGVGKTALVEGLALRMVEGKVPEELLNVSLNILDLGLLQAGAGVKGEFEKRLKQVIDEVKMSPVPIILFIDEAHTLIGAGGDAGGSDAANLLKPALARGELRTIAATTWSEYKKYFERDAALARRFQLVKVEEPDIATAITMLSGLKAFYQNHHRVLITDEAIKAAVELSSRYINGRQLPDKAIDLLDTAAARVRMGQATPPAVVEIAEAELAHIARRLAHLEEEGEQGLTTPDALIEELNVEMARLQSELVEARLQWQIELALVQKLQEQRPAFQEGTADKNAQRREVTPEMRSNLAAARGELKANQGKSPYVYSEVDAGVVASVVSDWTGVPVGSMVSDLAIALLEFDDKLTGRVVGQDQAVAKIGKTLRARAAGLTRSDSPLGVFLLAGPSGVGKTETARAIAEYLFGGERFLISINMSEYQEAHTVSQLKGSPPGYVGYGEGGVLTEAVRQRPYSVVLLDEIEKAHPDVAAMFYQVFDRGFMRDGEGREIDFTNSVIIMTSNLGADRIMDLWQSHMAPADGDVVAPAAEAPAKAKKGAKAKAAEAGKTAPESVVAANEKPALSIDKIEAEIQPELLQFFPQALLARMQVIPFLPLDREALKLIVSLKLDKVAQRLQETHKMQMRCQPAVIEHLADLCQRPELGARHVDALIDRQLLPNVARTLLGFMVDDNVPDILSLVMDENKQIACDFFDLADGAAGSEPTAQSGQVATA